MEVNGSVLTLAVASAAMLLLPGLCGGSLFYFALRGTRWAGLAASLGSLGGALLGFLAMVFLFYETRWDPPVEITFEVPPGYSHETVILLEDPSAEELAWSGLFTERAFVAVPRGGVVRVRSVAPFFEHDRVAFLSTGERDLGISMMPAPPGLDGATRIVAFDFGTPPDTEEELSSLRADELRIVVQHRESE